MATQVHAALGGPWAQPAPAAPALSSPGSIKGDGSEHHHLPALSSAIPDPAFPRSPSHYHLSVKSDGFAATSCRTTQVYAVFAESLG